MNRHLLREWSRRVHADDTIICLGDIAHPDAWRDRRLVLDVRNCPGERILVLGNHDHDTRRAARRRVRDDVRRGPVRHRPTAGPQPSAANLPQRRLLTHRIGIADSTLRPSRPRHHLLDGHRSTPRQHAPDSRPARRANEDRLTTARIHLAPAPGRLNEVETHGVIPGSSVRRPRNRSTTRSRPSPGSRRGEHQSRSVYGRHSGLLVGSGPSFWMFPSPVRVPACDLDAC